MLDKIIVDLSTKKDLREHCENLANELAAKILQFPDLMARQNQVELDSQRADDGRIQWHCVMCGHYWEGHAKINPERPTNCSKCKRPDWDDPTKACTHDQNCPDCLSIVKRELKDVEKLTAILEIAAKHSQEQSS